jgi:hypothetical protein
VAFGTRDWKLLRGAVTTWERDWELLTGWKRWLVVAADDRGAFSCADCSVTVWRRRDGELAGQSAGSAFMLPAAAVPALAWWREARKRCWAPCLVSP